MLIHICDNIACKKTEELEGDGIEYNNWVTVLQEPYKQLHFCCWNCLDSYVKKERIEFESLFSKKNVQRTNILPVSLKEQKEDTNFVYVTATTYSNTDDRINKVVFTCNSLEEAQVVAENLKKELYGCYKLVRIKTIKPRYNKKSHAITFLPKDKYMRFYVSKKEE